MNYPEEIEGTYLEIAATREQIKRRRAKIRSLEIDITVEATTAKGPDNKLLLSNDLMRKAAVEKMVGESEEFSGLAEELGHLEQDEDRLQARLERLRLEVKLHILECEQNNAIAALKVADAIWHARTNAGKASDADEPEAEFSLPF